MSEMILQNQGSPENSIKGIIEKMLSFRASEKETNIIPFSSKSPEELVFRKPVQEESQESILTPSLVKIFDLLKQQRLPITRSLNTLSPRRSIRKILNLNKKSKNPQSILPYLIIFNKEWQKTNTILRQHTKIFENISKNITDIKSLLIRDRLSEFESLRERNKNSGGVSLMDNDASTISGNNSNKEKGLISRLADFIVPMLGAGFIGRMFTGIPGIAAVRNIFNRIPNLFANIRNALKKIPSLLNNIKSFFSRIPKFLADIRNTIRNLPSILSNLYANIRNIPRFAASAISSMKNYVTNSSVGRAVSGGFSAVKSVAGRGVDAIKSAGSTAIDYGKKGFQVAKSFGSKALSLGSRAGTFLGSMFGKAKTLSKDAMKSKLAMGVKKALPTIGKNLSKFFGPVLTAILSAVDLYSTVNDAKREASENMLTNPSAAKDSLERGKEKIGISISKGLGSVGGSVLGGVLGSFIPVPGLGTIIGALGGGFVGDLVGGLIGDAIGGKNIYDTLEPMLDSLGLGLNDVNGDAKSQTLQPATSLIHQMPMMDVRSVSEDSYSDLNFKPISNNTESEAIKSINLNDSIKFSRQHSNEMAKVEPANSINQFTSNTQNSYYVGRQYYRSVEPELIKRAN